ncbi:MAG: Na/Pi cotransporter family protein [Muribaculaceae bacterium]|nr:Na/Pi cotransporter family protein [Bacteroides sp.]MDE6222826.1 Na/Pi cotransporter family protein [Muribaculaceae bacterium]MDE6229506.1 Na/Pi cotransporter family protein [Muribaculaceae bacterium]MDE6817822.1 Na/Pi cotransporter family protein [Muribaculaceae bacterium]
MSYSILDLLCLLGAVCLFLYGMKVMSEGLQKVAGERLRNILSVMTSNRFSGMVTGIGLTALLQSSSASTVMVVSFVNSGLMTLSQAMAVIFGANVGTTFTYWVISMFGFKIDMSTFMLPLIGVAVPLMFSSSSRNKSLGEFFIGFAFLFMGLDMISTYVPDLQANPEMFAFLQQYTHSGFGSVLIFALVGCLLTMVIQSSAATFAIALIMCAKGWVTFDLACALVLGANLGTCITPVLASLSGNVGAKRTALGHVLFNVLGLIWMLPLFFPFVHMIEWLIGQMGQSDPTQLYYYVTHIAETEPDVYNHLFDNSLPAGHHVVKQIAAMQVAVSFGMSLFQTVYKLINGSIMIWFTGLYVKVVEYVIPSKNHDEEFSLKYIGSNRVSASELNIVQVEKEVAVFAQRVDRMLGMDQELLHMNAKTKDFNQLFSRLGKYEDISDRMEREIADFLNRTAQGRLSNDGKRRVSALFNINSEIESIGDSCNNFGRVLSRKQEVNVHFSDLIKDNIDSMFVLVSEAMNGMINMLENIENVREEQLLNAYNKEREINNLRNQLRAKNVENINNGLYDYQAGIFFMDAVSDLEKVGDYIINVVDTIRDSMTKHTI